MAAKCSWRIRGKYWGWTFNEKVENMKWCNLLCCMIWDKLAKNSWTSQDSKHIAFSWVCTHCLWFFSINDSHRSSSKSLPAESAANLSHNIEHSKKYKYYQSLIWGSYPVTLLIYCTLSELRTSFSVQFYLGYVTNTLNIFILNIFLPSDAVLIKANEYCVYCKLIIKTKLVSWCLQPSPKTFFNNSLNYSIQTLKVVTKIVEEFYLLSLNNFKENIPLFYFPLPHVLTYLLPLFLYYVSLSLSLPLPSWPFRPLDKFA